MAVWVKNVPEKHILILVYNDPGSQDYRFSFNLLSNPVVKSVLKSVVKSVVTSVTASVVASVGRAVVPGNNAVVVSFIGAAVVAWLKSTKSSKISRSSPPIEYYKTCHIT